MQGQDEEYNYKQVFFNMINDEKISGLESMLKNQSLEPWKFIENSRYTSIYYLFIILLIFT